MTSYLGLLPRTINFVFPLQSRRRRHLRSRHACGIFSKSCHATLDARVITSPHPSPKERGREERAARKGGSLALQSFLRNFVREQEEDILCERMAMLLCKNRGVPHSYFCGPKPQKNVFAIVHTPRRMRGGREVVQQIRRCGRERGREDERQEDERQEDERCGNSKNNYSVYKNMA